MTERLVYDYGRFRNRVKSRSDAHVERSHTAIHVHTLYMPTYENTSCALHVDAVRPVTPKCIKLWWSIVSVSGLVRTSES